MSIVHSDLKLEFAKTILSPAYAQTLISSNLLEPFLTVKMCYKKESACKAYCP